MRQNTAKMSLAIKIITALVLLLTFGLMIGALIVPKLLWAAAAMVLVCVVCYLLTPVAYELSDERLTVFTHLGHRTFAPVVSCERVDSPMGLSIRVFGNGGFFGGTGFFWNAHYGMYRAYVTTARREQMVMIRTDRQKVLISPENPDAFLSACAPGSGGRNASSVRQEQFV